jgi:hypothetical protein
LGVFHSPGIISRLTAGAMIIQAVPEKIAYFHDIRLKAIATKNNTPTVRIM